MPAVVLGGGHSALSVARSLGKLGVAVDYISEGANLPVGQSRYVRRHLELGRGPDLGDRWLEWLLASEPSVVLFCSGHGATLVARWRPELEARGHLPMEANDEILLAMVDKVRTYELARQAGVPCPWSFGIASQDELDDALQLATFPCVVKPALSLFALPNLPPGNKGLLIDGPDELRDVVRPALRQGHSVVVTEFIPGPPDSFSSYYSYLDSSGQPLFHVTKRKLRQYPLDFGEGTYHLMHWDQEVAALGLRFFQGIGLRGLANVEFRRDSRDGRFKLIECNPRFTAANELIRRAGLDLGRFCYQRLVGGPVTVPGRLEDGASLWSASEDWRAFREHHRKGELPAAVWLRQALRRHEPALLDWRDPTPALVRSAQRVRGRGQRLLARAPAPLQSEQRSPIGPGG